MKLSLPKHWRVFVVLALLLTGAASAAGCESPMGSATQARISLESFVPDPGCWVLSVIQQLNEFAVPAFAENLGKGLLSIFAAVWLGTAIVNQNWNNVLIKLVFAGAAASMINGYGGGQGPAYIIGQQFMNGWRAAYTTTADKANHKLNYTIQENSVEMAKNVHNYMTTTAAIRSIQAKQQAMSGITDPMAIDRLMEEVEQEQKNQQNTDDERTSPLTGMTMNFSYLLLMGVYAVFASIIFSSGMMMALLVALLPLIIAVSGIGMASAGWGALSLAIGNILVVAITPMMMSLLIGTAMDAPMKSLNQSLEYNASQSRQQLVQTKRDFLICASSSTWFTDPPKAAEACKQSTTGRVGDVTGAITSGINDVAMGLGLAVCALVISFATMMLQLRRIPAAVMQVMGTTGGGESSGVGSNPATAALGKTASTTLKVATKGGGMGKGNGPRQQRTRAGEGQKPDTSTTSGKSPKTRGPHRRRSGGTTAPSTPADPASSTTSRVSTRRHRRRQTPQTSTANVNTPAPVEDEDDTLS